MLLLSDVFEHFRKTRMNYYKFDPPNYLTAPSLTSDAMPIHTNDKLDLISNVGILMMIVKI